MDDIDLMFIQGVLMEALEGKADDASLAQALTIVEECLPGTDLMVVPTEVNHDESA